MPQPPRLPAFSSWKPANPPGTKAGLLSKGKQPTVLLFFFFPHPSGRSGRFGVPAAPGLCRVPPRRPRWADPGRMCRRGAGGRGRPRSLSLASLLGNGLAGEGPGGAGRGGCYFCRFLFLAATSPWQPCYSPRPLPRTAGARDPGRSLTLVSHLPCSRLPTGPPPLAPRPHPVRPGAPSFPPLPPPRAAAGARGPGGRLMGDAY